MFIDDTQNHWKCCGNLKVGNGKFGLIGRNDSITVAHKYKAAAERKPAPRNRKLLSGIDKLLSGTHALVHDMFICGMKRCCCAEYIVSNYCIIPFSQLHGCRWIQTVPGKWRPLIGYSKNVGARAHELCGKEHLLYLYFFVFFLFRILGGWTPKPHSGFLLLMLCKCQIFLPPFYYDCIYFV